MRGLALVSAALALSGASRAQAHRLDEYLQQTLIELQPGRIVLHVDLTPGVALAPGVIPLIDTDHDGALSAPEQASYAEQLRAALSLRIDDQPLRLRVVEAHYPTLGALAQGLGTIAITLDAELAGHALSGTLRYANHHAAAGAVYLVNCLLPRDPAIHLGAQRRSPDQASYQLALGPDSNEGLPFGLRASIWAVLCVGGVLLLWRTLKRAAIASASDGS